MGVDLRKASPDEVLEELACARLSNLALCRLLVSTRSDLRRAEVQAADAAGEGKELRDNVDALAQWLGVSQPRSTIPTDTGRALTRMAAIRDAVGALRFGGTHVDLDAVDALLADASPAPWVAKDGSTYHEITAPNGDRTPGYDGELVAESLQRAANRKLVCAARELLPRLTQEVRRLRAGAANVLAESQVEPPSEPPPHPSRPLPYDKRDLHDAEVTGGERMEADVIAYVSALADAAAVTDKACRAVVLGSLRDDLTACKHRGAARRSTAACPACDSHLAGVRSEVDHTMAAGCKLSRGTDCPRCLDATAAPEHRHDGGCEDIPF